MKILFEASNGVKREIGFADNVKDGWQIIRRFLKEHNFESHYHRINIDDDNRMAWIDVGSHTEFFYFTDMDVSQMEELRNAI